MPYEELKATLTDIGTEEIGHFEMVGTIVHQLMRGLSEEEIKNSPAADYFVDHTAGIYPVAASGAPFSADMIASTGDTLADLNEDLAADATTLYEQTAFSKCRKPLILLGFCHF